MKSEKYIHNMKFIIKELLNSIGVSLKYIDNSNTSKKSNKMIMEFVHFKNEKKLYNGRLDANEMRLNVNELKLNKNSTSTYSYIIKDMETKKQIKRKTYKSLNPNYYTTYKVEQSSKLKKMMKVVELCDIKTKKHIFQTKVLIQLLGHQKVYPIVCSA